MLKTLGARPGTFRAVPWHNELWKVVFMGENNLKNYRVMLSREDAEDIAREMNGRA